MSDYIKREDAMKPLYEKWKAAESRGDDDIAEIVKMDYITVSNVPSADVAEVKHGKWIKATDDGVWSYADAYSECDQCHTVIVNGWDMKFCPNCGARMDRKEQDHE